MAVTPVTNPVQPAEWAINDEVIRLREWAGDRVYPLFIDDRGTWTIGSASTSRIRVQDAKRRVSRRHAHLERVRGRWQIVDDGSTNGVFIDGERRDQATLVPCAEIGLGGGVGLLAESARSIALREGLARMLGWAPAQAEAVDLALRAVRLAASRRAFLVLCGDQELVPLAVELHRLTFPPERPFVLCNPSRITPQTAAVPVRCVHSGLEALAEAPGGTVCLYHRYLPPDLIPLLRDLRIPECQTQLVICSPQVRDAQLFNPTPIVIPRLSTRTVELERLIESYADEAAAHLGVEGLRFSGEARAWMIKRCSQSLAVLQRVTLRLAALVKAGSYAGAGELLGISHTAMSKWLRHRGFTEDMPLVPAEPVVEPPS